MGERSRGRRASTAVAGAVLLVGALLITGADRGPAAGARGAAAAAPVDGGTIVVDAGTALRPVNRSLVGTHGRSDATQIATEYDDLAPRTFRHVMSAHDFVSYDCATDTLAASTVDYFGSWIDAVVGEGADPILALSYVPPCYARGGQPKAPAIDQAGYRRFLDQLLGALITDRVAAGKEPMRRFELWNEPDIPLFRDDPSTGHGFVGTADEFVASNLPALAAAVAKAEADSGIDVLVGTPAAYSPWPMGRFGATLADLLADVNRLPRDQAEAIAAQADAAFGAGATDRILHDGGLEYPQKTLAAAPGLGLDIDFVSVHLYSNNPLQGLDYPEPAEPKVLYGRQPYASPEDFRALAEEWAATVGDLELVVSEWALNSSADMRFGGCEAAAFDLASLGVMQDVGIDRALYLGQPTAVERAPFLAWNVLPATQVAAALPEGADDVWTTAATDGDRTTLLVSQWHPELTAATDRSYSLQVDGLPDGTYDVTIERIGESAQQSSVAETATATVVDGTVTLDGAVRLEGQSFARIDLRRAGVDPLPPLSTATGTERPNRCLAAPTPPPTTSSTTTTTAPTTTVPAPPAAPPQPGQASYAG